MRQEIEILKEIEKTQERQDKQQYREMKKDEYLYRQHVVTSIEGDKMRRMKREGKTKEEIEKYFEERSVELTKGQQNYLKELYENK